MYNLHPPFSAFPFVLICLVVFFELIQIKLKHVLLDKIIKSHLLLLLPAILAAFLSGYQGRNLANQTFPVPDSIISTHHSTGRLLLFGVLPCVAFRFLVDYALYYKTLWKILYVLFLGAMLLLVLTTGYLGAELVFSYGAGVRIENKGL